MKYYHITAPENIASILENGLRANEDGDIFLFENRSIVRPYSIYMDEDGEWKIDKTQRDIICVADHIAMNQIFIDPYAMFEVDREGIEGELMPDDVAEIGADMQWIAKQPVISPEYISLFGVYEIDGWLEYNPEE